MAGGEGVFHEDQSKKVQGNLFSGLLLCTDATLHWRENTGLS